MKKTLAAIGVLGIAIGLIACSTGTDTAPTETTSGPNELLPQAIRDAGVLRIATDPSLPPCTFLPAGATDPVGLDIDIMDAVGKYLGVEIEWQKGKFEGMLTAVASGRADAAAGCLSDYGDREEQATFIDYAYALIGFTVDATNPHNLTADDPMSLCGATVALQIGSSSPAHLDQYSQFCADNGGEPITQLSFPSAAEALLSLSSGRADAYITSYGAGAYQEKETNGQVKVIAPPEIPDRYYVKAQPKVYIGVAVSKEDTELQDAILGAVQHVRTTGDLYEEILEKWNVSTFSLDEVGINLHTARPIVDQGGE